MLFCYYLINISKMNESSDNEKESQEVILTSNNRKVPCLDYKEDEVKVQCPPPP